MKKNILMFVITLLSFFISITAFGPWRLYRTSDSNTIKLPVWYGSYVLGMLTEHESDEAYLKELNTQIQRYEQWEETEVKKNVLKWFKDERDKVKKRLNAS